MRSGQGGTGWLVLCSLVEVLACSSDATSLASTDAALSARDAASTPSPSVPGTPSATHDAQAAPSTAQGDAAIISKPSDGGTHDPAPSGDAGGSVAMGATVLYGTPYSGGEFHLGPVDWQQSQWPNACAAATKYPSAVQQAEGVLLAGIWSGIGHPEAYCDACIQVQTEKGKSALLRVVTSGDTSKNSIDVSPEAFAILNSGEYPRNATWQFAKCPDTGPLMYEFKTGANEWWDSFWVRNARVPLKSVEVMGTHHAYAPCTQDGDGAWVDAAGSGQGAFSIRVTAIDGQVVVDSLNWPAAGLAGQVLPGQANFQ